MAITLSCPKCVSILEVPDGFANKVARCPTCKHEFVVAPAPAPASDAIQVDPPRPPRRVDERRPQVRSGSSRPMWLALGIPLATVGLLAACCVVGFMFGLVKVRQGHEIEVHHDAVEGIARKRAEEIAAKKRPLEKMMIPPPNGIDLEAVREEAIEPKEEIVELKVDAPAPMAGFGRDDLRVPDNEFRWSNREVAPKVPLQQRMTRPNQQTGVLGPKSELWGKLREQVKAKKLLKTSIQNGNWGTTPFADTPDEGSLLVGFYANSGMWMGYVQPIFLTADHEKPGKAYGMPRDEVSVLRAKPGYAVGRMYVRAGDLFDGFGVTYMKVTANGLDSEDAYDSEFIGGMGGSGLDVGGDGAFMVGVHGRLISMAGIVPVGNVATLGGVCVKLR
ncbi:MAG TPA: hypothetical protein VFE62_15335 [Gemmataceae bacterium]|nr:hypothetical protein [Gemmataceae bacterium]